MHRANPDTPIEETMRAMAELKAYVIWGIPSNGETMANVLKGGKNQVHRPV
jgi:hypothetical protein